MSTTPPPPAPSAPDPEPSAPPPPAQSTPWVLYALTGLALAAVGALIGGATLYLTWQHPALATPIAAAGAVIGLFLTTVTITITIALARR